MADIDLKTETPDTSLPTTGFLFGADSQAAASPSVFTVQSVATTLLGSTSLTGATITTSQPVLDLSQTWNASGVTFTGLKFNATDTASASGSLLMDLQVGGASQLQITKTGRINGPTGGALNINGALEVFGSSVRVGANFPLQWFTDTFLTRRAAANLRLGAADTGATTSTVTITIAAPGVVTWTGHGFSTGTPVVFTTTGALPTGITAGTTYYAVVVDANTFQIASSVANAIAATPTVITTSGTQSGTHTGTRYNITQRLSMQSVTGVTDRLGADLIITGSQGTGTGAGGSIIFQVAPAGLSGTAQNALVDALIIQTGTRLKMRSGSVAGSAGSGLFSLDNTAIAFGQDAGGIVWGGITGSGFTVDAAAYYSFGSSGTASPDTILRRDAANTLALRNGANAQTLRVYSTFTDASNYERGALNAGADFIELAAETAGTGDDNLDVRLTPAGTGNVRFGTHTATSDTAVSGYIEIKDAGGTIRKLAVIT